MINNLIGLIKSTLKYFLVSTFHRKLHAKISGYLLHVDNEGEVDEADKSKLSIFNSPTLVVQNGPFKGMKYAKLDSVGSTIYPKILGSYEMEIWDFIERAKLNKYSVILDIGCAEGYYAIGLAMNNKQSKVYAYDTQLKARELCHEMASLNNVSGNVIINGELTEKGLNDFVFEKKGLIICDCEGFERELFNESNLENIKNCDLIIETHDFIDIEISSYLKNLFRSTHDIISVKSTDDIQKAHEYKFKELANLDLHTKKKVLSERRPSIMEWLICHPKNS